MICTICLYQSSIILSTLSQYVLDTILHERCNCILIPDSSNASLIIKIISQLCVSGVTKRRDRSLSPDLCFPRKFAP